MRALAFYTVARLAVLATMTALLWLLGLDGFVLILVAVALSLPVSYLLLARQRDAVAAELDRWLTERRERRARLRSRLRSRLRGDDTDENTGEDSGRPDHGSHRG